MVAYEENAFWTIRGFFSVIPHAATGKELADKLSSGALSSSYNTSMLYAKLSNLPPGSSTIFNTYRYNWHQASHLLLTPKKARKCVSNPLIIEIEEEKMVMVTQIHKWCHPANRGHIRKDPYESFLKGNDKQIYVSVLLWQNNVHIANKQLHFFPFTSNRCTSIQFLAIHPKNVSKEAKNPSLCFGELYNWW